MAHFNRISENEYQIEIFMFKALRIVKVMLTFALLLRKIPL